MEKLDINVKGFKCFDNDHFELNNITLLTGANASGKSSVIQALLLLKDASESDGSISLLSLNDPRFAFDFGDPDTLINNKQKTDVVTISLPGSVSMTFEGGRQDSGRKLSVVVDGLDGLKETFSNGLTYFTAERQGPRYEYVRKAVDENGCGCRGENTGNVMADKWNTRIGGKKLLVSSEDKALFNVALDDWVDYIFPGLNVRIQQIGVQSYQVLIRDGFHSIQTESTNIGFGISYALPIIVGALLANDGSWLVVENPEAHIHAKAQSNIGYFLGMMAASGLRVVVETHSEHVVNGVRRAAIVSGRLFPDDVNIYFFKGNSEIKLITIDGMGNLSDFPVDFFDQSRQDMLEIINKRKGK